MYMMSPTRVGCAKARLSRLPVSKCPLRPMRLPAMYEHCSIHRITYTACTLLILSTSLLRSMTSMGVSMSSFATPCTVVSFHGHQHTHCSNFCASEEQPLGPANCLMQWPGSYATVQKSQQGMCLWSRVAAAEQELL